MTPKYEEKFIVINKKHLNSLPNSLYNEFSNILRKISKFLPNNKYYVCNQDEPYAERILEIILDEEKKKEDKNDIA